MQQQGQITDDGSVTFPDKVAMSIERLRHFEPPEGYLLKYSGGKDSDIILHLAKVAGVKFQAQYNLTTVDPPELVHYIKREHPEVEISKPAMTMWQLIVKKGFPPTRVVRYCCDVLKERDDKDRRLITGIRWAESNRRSKRRMVEQCFKRSSTLFVNPIIDWADEDVWCYIHTNGVTYCRLYDEGFKRLGCVMCPMQGPKGMERDAKRWPKIYQAYLRTFGRMLDKKWKQEGFNAIKFHTAEDVMHWWIYNPPKGDPDQGVLFE